MAQSDDLQEKADDILSGRRKRAPSVLGPAAAEATLPQRPFSEFMPEDMPGRYVQPWRFITVP